MTDRKGARKSTGSYYTPESLVTLTINMSLQKLIQERLRDDATPESLLSLTVCDPACGAGVFLVAAVDRIAAWVAFLRTGTPDPTEDAVREARRDVVANCMYGVDLNPMAVELTRLTLLVEALAPGAPNPFLGHRIKHGNALIGVTPALLKDGIPDAAFKPIEGDDKKYAAELRKRNKAERAARGLQ